MNTDPISEIWNSAANQPDAAAGQHLASQLVARVRRRRRLQAIWLAWTIFALAVVTALAVVHFVRNGLVGAADEWALLPLLALPWFVTVHFLRHFFRENTGRVASVLPLSTALAAARADNRAERRRLTVIACLFAGMVPVLAVSIWQLHAVGKATADQAWSMALVFGAILSIGAAFIAVRYRIRLLPEMRRIEALLRDLDPPAAS